MLYLSLLFILVIKILFLKKVIFMIKYIKNNKYLSILLKILMVFMYIGQIYILIKAVCTNDASFYTNILEKILDLEYFIKEFFK